MPDIFNMDAFSKNRGAVGSPRGMPRGG